MRLTSENKAKIRKRILAGSAGLFRKRGIDAVSLDDLMQAAGLTRGAFYAHFKSKSALVAEVLQHEHPLLRMLEARDGASPQALWQQMQVIFSAYLDPVHVEEVHAGCTLAALTGEAARAPQSHRTAFEAALSAVVQEMQRGLDPARCGGFLGGLVHAAAAVNTARACDTPAMRAAILGQANLAMTSALADARPETDANR